MPSTLRLAADTNLRLVLTPEPVAMRRSSGRQGQRNGRSSAASSRRAVTHQDSNSARILRNDAQNSRGSASTENDHSGDSVASMRSNSEAENPHALAVVRSESPAENSWLVLTGLSHRHYTHAYRYPSPFASRAPSHEDLQSIFGWVTGIGLGVGEARSRRSSAASDFSNVHMRVIEVDSMIFHNLDHIFRNLADASRTGSPSPSISSSLAVHLEQPTPSRPSAALNGVGIEIETLQALAEHLDDGETNEEGVETYHLQDPDTLPEILTGGYLTGIGRQLQHDETERRRSTFASIGEEAEPEDEDGHH